MGLVELKTNSESDTVIEGSMFMLRSRALRVQERSADLSYFLW